MAAFNLEHEQRRLAEVGLTYEAKVVSTKDSLRTLIAERTKAPSYFEMTIAENRATAVGYEHRGDLDNSFKKSEVEAPTDAIAARFALETRGFNEAKKDLISLPLYSTVMLFSPPPEVDIEGYSTDESMVYLYHILPGNKEDEREIKAVSWLNTFTKEEQADILNSFKDKKDVEATEESILISPVGVKSNGTEDATSFRHLWRTIEDKYRQKKGSDLGCPPALYMEKLMLEGDKVYREENLEVSILMEEVARRMANGATEAQIAKEFNIMLALAHKKMLHKNWGEVKPRQEKEQWREYMPTAAILFDRNRELAYQVPEVKTSCGMSGGMKMGGGIFGSILSGEPTVNSWSFKIGKGRDFSFDQPGPCRLCGRDTMCGPCKICQGCNNKIDSGELTVGE